MPRITLLVSGRMAGRRAGANGAVSLKGCLESVIGAAQRTVQQSGMQLRLLVDAACATGAMAARVACDRRLDLHLLAEGQPTDLTADQSRAERVVWLGASESDLAGGRSTEVCQEILLGMADAVLMAWDGADADSLDANMHLMLNAVLAMKPVIWIDADGDARVLDLTRMTQSRRHLLQCRTADGTVLRECFQGPSTGAMLDSQIEESLRVTLVSARAGQSSGEPLAPARRRIPAGSIHRAMTALVQGQLSRAANAFLPSTQGAYRGPAWSAAEGLVAATPELDSTFDRADIAATIAAGKHRSAAWVSSACATLAVFAAVAGAIGLWPGGNGALWGILEILLIATVIGLLSHVKRQNWHNHWTANRFVAEQIRYARMGLPLLALTKSNFEPWLCVLTQGEGAGKVGVLSPDLALLQRSMAEQGLPRGHAGGHFVAAQEENLPKLRDFVLAVVKDQIHYQHRIHAEQHSIHHRFDVLSLVLFCLTCAAVLGHFVLHANWLLIFTAFLPALAAGLHGLATTLEIARIADQSRTTMDKLQHIHQAVQVSLDAPGSVWRKWATLRQLTLMAAEVMSDENNQWQKLLDHQKPRLPA